MIRLVVFALFVSLLLISSAFAGARMHREEGDGPAELPACVPDGNDIALDATPVEHSGYIVEVVCPDDPIDYYSFNVPAGADVEGGIMFASDGPGAVVRLTEGDRILFEQATSDSERIITVPVTITDSPGSTFYLRVTYYSSYPNEHYYYLLTRLELSGCYEEGNEEKSAATRIFFGDTIKDVLCAGDTVDWYYFHVNETDEEEDGWVSLDPDAQSTRVTFYDAHDTELLARTITDGTSEKFGFGDIGGIHRFNSYYIKVEILTPAADAEYKYTLSLGKGSIFKLLAPASPLAALAATTPIWPCPLQDKFNTSRVMANGPGRIEQVTNRYLALGTVLSGDHPAVGPSGDIYFINNIDTIRCIDINGDVKWERRYQDALDGPFLDDEGVWTANDDFIYHCDYNGSSSTPVALPAEIVKPVKLLALFDDKLYFRAGSNGFDLWCVKKDGSAVFLADAMGPTSNVAVDRHGNVYALSYYNITKLSPTGTQLWQYWFRNAHRAGDTVIQDSSSIAAGPYIGKDMRIFAAAMNSSGDTHYFLLNEDGTENKKLLVTADDIPRAVVTDLDGNYYIADRNQRIRKFDGTLDSKWTIDIPGIVDDMYMENNGRAYIAYYIASGMNIFGILAINSNGNTMWNQIVEDTPYMPTHHAKIFPGKDKKLIFVTNAGRFVTYKDASLEFTPEELGPMQPGGSSTPSLQPMHRIGG